MTHCVVEPVLHKSDASPDGAHHCVDEPEQTEPLPVIELDGSELTIVVANALPEHPFASETVTVKVFAVLTIIHCVVAPVLQL